MSDYIVSGEELNKLREDASVSKAIKELAEVLTGRANDVPHRFRAPKTLQNYFNPEFPNQTYQYSTNIRGDSKAAQYDQQMLMGTNNSSMPLVLRMTTRPAQGILELEFDDSYGTRLFTLEIEYAIQEEREVLLPWRTKVHPKADHRNPSRQSPAKASSFLSASPGRNWRRISRRLGGALIPSIRNQNRLRFWEFRDRAKPIGFVKLCRNE